MGTWKRKHLYHSEKERIIQLKSLSLIRLDILQTKIQDSSIILINYYAPNVEGAENTVLSEINDIINNLVSEEDTTILWGGDFNSFFMLN